MCLQALREYTGDMTYIFDPEGIITDEHGSNRESIRPELKPCELHFYNCAHKVSKATWSAKSRKKFITNAHVIYTAEAFGTYEARQRALLEWAESKIIFNKKSFTMVINEPRNIYKISFFLLHCVSIYLRIIDRVRGLYCKISD